MGARVTPRRSADRQAKSDRGAAMVEFALVLPLLVVMLIGVIEFGWLFAQNLNVRHGAREGARLVAINFNPYSSSGSSQTGDIVTEVCGRIDAIGAATVAIDGSGQIGDPATATVSVPGTSITGLLNWAIPSGLVLSSSVETRLEQPATWTDTALPQSCP